MSQSVAIGLTLLVYMALLIGIGLWASRRTADADDFFLGGRRMGGLVAAISASASSSSAWTLLGVSGAAYSMGWPALWLFPATVSGFLINWFILAPRLMRATRASGAVTVTEFVAGRTGTAIARLGSVIILFSFLFYVAAQFQAAGDAFSSTFGVPIEAGVIAGALIILLYTLLGGFWAVSVTDTVQGLLMAAAAIVLPVAALHAVGGPSALYELLNVGAGSVSHASGREGGMLAAVGFVVGTMGIGLGYPGQPHVVNRFMALRDEQALRRGRAVAVAWAVVVYAGMLLLGLCARVLLDTGQSGEQAFFALTTQLFPPVVAGVIIAAVLSAIMSTADSQLLVAASAAAHDYQREQGSPAAALRRSRLAVLLLCTVATAVALLAPATIYSRVLFAWHALGSAFGPLILALAFGRAVPSGARFAAMIVGFGGTVLLHWWPDAPGDWMERLLPLFASAAIVAATMRQASGRTDAREGQQQH